MGSDWGLWVSWAFLKRLALVSGFVFTFFWLGLSPVGVIFLLFFNLKYVKRSQSLESEPEPSISYVALMMAKIHQARAETKASHFENPQILFHDVNNYNTDRVKSYLHVQKLIS